MEMAARNAKRTMVRFVFCGALDDLPHVWRIADPKEKSTKDAAIQYPRMRWRKPINTKMRNGRADGV